MSVGERLKEERERLKLTQEVAEYRLIIIKKINWLVNHGVSKKEAILLVAPKIHAATIHRWYALTKRLSISDWLPALLPRHKGRTPSFNKYRIEIYSVFKRYYLNPIKRSYAECYLLTSIEATERYWGLMPSLYLLKTRLEQDYNNDMREYLRSSDTQKRKLISKCENKIIRLRISLKMAENYLASIKSIQVF